MPATKATKPGRTARPGRGASARVVAAFWARTLRWLASPTVGVDGAQAGQHLVDAAAGEHQRVHDRRPAAGSGRRWPRRGWSAAASASPAPFEQSGPVGGEHGPDEAGEGREPAGAERQPGRRRDDVFELVRLVEDDHVVLGQERLAAGEVQPVEVGVDDHERRRPGPAGAPPRRSTARRAGSGWRRGTPRSTRSPPATPSGSRAHVSSAWSPVGDVAAQAASRDS